MKLYIKLAMKTAWLAFVRQFWGNIYSLIYNSKCNDQERRTTERYQIKILGKKKCSNSFSKKVNGEITVRSKHTLITHWTPDLLRKSITLPVL